MAKQLNNMEDVIEDLVSNWQNPVFCDVKIICSDGEIPANKTILGMRSQYFLSMFSSNNNFVESQDGIVKLPHSKVVMEKLVTFLYSGQLDCEDLGLGSMLDLLGLFDLINLSKELKILTEYTVKKINEGNFTFSDCLGNLEFSSMLGLVGVGKALLAHLGKNFLNISKLTEVGSLSEDMMRRLLQENKEDGSQTILRYAMAVYSCLTWGN